MEDNTRLDYVRYIGRMKQPLQRPDISTPSMFIVSDYQKHELALLILTPGTFLHAFRFVRSFGAKALRIFTPSLRPEFISDIFNLYMLLKKKDMPVNWVFPDKYNHYEFSMGQIQTNAYQLNFNSRLTINYVKNNNVDDVYDIIVRTIDGTHYFSFFMTKETLKEFSDSLLYDFIHLPKSSTLYGGLTYDSSLKEYRKSKRKLVPHDFSSEDEYELFFKSPFKY